MHQRTWYFGHSLRIVTILAGLLVACADQQVVAPTTTAQFAMGGGNEDKDKDKCKPEDGNDRDKGRGNDKNNDQCECKDNDKGNNKDKDKDKDKNKNKCEASVKVTPVMVVLKPGDSKQLNVVTKNCPESAVTYSSSKPSVATVSPTGVVTALKAGMTTITVRCNGASDSSTVTVLPRKHGRDGDGGDGGGGNADPTQLPAASGQTPDPTYTYGRTLASGQTYRDPLTGVTVLKVTDGSTPRVNLLGTDKGYSEGGPIISQPWISGGETYYTFTVTVEGEQYLVDLRYETLELTNWRRVTYASEIGFAFSLNPATPRIAYLVDPSGMSVNRYNTATNAIENTGNWPWIPTGGERIDWLQNNVNDTWFVAMFNSNNTVIAFRPADGRQQSFLEPLTDEPHIDRELPFVYISTNDDVRQNVIGNLETGAVRLPENSVFQSDDHEAPLRGMVTGLSNYARRTNFYYDVRADTTVEYVSADRVVGLPGDWHMAGQWVFGNGTGPAQWFVIDAWGRPDPLADIQSGLIGIVRPSPFSARLVAVHDSYPTTYESQPQTTLSPDGKLVVWSSNMGGQTRTDVFLAKLPVSP
jgi:hypothetical protein